MKEISYTSKICLLDFIGQEENPRFTLAEMSREQRTRREENDSKRTQLGSPNGSPQQLFGKQDRLKGRNMAISTMKLKKGPWTRQGGCRQRAVVVARTHHRESQEQGSRQDLMRCDNLIKDSLPTFVQRQPCRTNLIY